MPTYLEFDSKIADLNEAEAEEQLREQMTRLQEAISRLQENDRLAPSMLEHVVSV